MAEFKTANDNMGDFTYMPGFSAVGAAMKQTAAKLPMVLPRFRMCSTPLRRPRWIRLKNLGLSVKE